MVVAFTSVAVLTVAALIGTSRGLSAGQQADRAAASTAVASAAAQAYAQQGGWAGADLTAADAAAAQAGARLIVRDAQGTVVLSPNGSTPNGLGTGMGMGMGNSAASTETPVVVNGTTVGTVRLAFGAGSSGQAQQIAWTWILVAAVAALLAALAVSWYVTRRLTTPLVQISAAARAFAAGDRSARAAIDAAAAPGELGDLARAFDASADAVERSELTRRRMAADLAHELRTPLAILQAGLEELRDGYVEADSARLAALHDQSVRMGRVVGDLSELSEAEAFTLTIRPELLDLSELAADALGAAMPSLAAAGLNVTTACDNGVMVWGDGDRLHQVVGNLLANTARHCRVGDSVTVTVCETDDSAMLTVADTGPGIAPENLDSVFDRLWRGRADVDSAGSGIGLAVVRELVTAHGGRVVATSDGIHGSTFTVTLPRADS